MIVDDQSTSYTWHDVSLLGFAWSIEKLVVRAKLFAQKPFRAEYGWTKPMNSSRISEMALFHVEPKYTG